jgi:1,4-alpha-glucan branching enzyme
MASTPSLVLVQDDPWLAPYEADLQQRLDRYHEIRSGIEAGAGSLREHAQAYQYFGLNYDAKAKGWHYREWAPRADQLYLTGDFNGWDRRSHPLSRNADGVWELFLPDQDYADKLTHESLVKVHIIGSNGGHDRIPTYIRRAVQNEATKDFAGQVWAPPKAFRWTDGKFDPGKIKAPLIYECHTGMAQEKEGLGTYCEFADNVLPRIQDLGYNAIQMMAVQEHPYYGSFGYHVSNFFAPSSRFGTPEDLKYLVNQAHKRGIAVIMDIVHSHAVKNFAEGLNHFDGSEDQYFHPGARGYHEGWDSKLFNYGKPEVRQFLLSNIAYWLEEFHFDGFRFDGVTSMLYFHHGNVSFDHYDKYFKDGVEWDAINYLQLANDLTHEIKPGALTIAEDMSGMPGGCRPVEEGGLGFDYRLGMGIPDYWIKLLKHQRDEDWNVNEIWQILNNRRWKEKTISYAESHDQGLVGDKTIAFWLMDKEMYFHMSIGDDHPVIDRGIAMHKIIRLLSAAVGGEGYLNFIGNEFGHPEWIDFPREGNGWSYKYARRQWSLVDNQALKYQWLNAFDRAMIHMLGDHEVLAALPAQPLNLDDHNNVMVFERNNLIFVVNLHPDRAIADYRFPAHAAGAYRVVLNSDAPEFGGFDRIDTSLTYTTQMDDHDTPWLSVYATNRTVLVLARQ